MLTAKISSEGKAVTDPVAVYAKYLLRHWKHKADPSALSDNNMVIHWPLTPFV